MEPFVTIVAIMAGAAIWPGIPFVLATRKDRLNNAPINPFQG